MKKRNLGFTLIELLAVIVVLALIAVIATPVVVKTINDAKKGAFRSTAYSIINAAENYHSRKIIIGEKLGEITYTYSNGIETSSPAGHSLEYKGPKPKSGKVVVNEKAAVKLAIHDGTYCVEKGFEDTEVIVSEKTPVECNF